VAAESEIQFEDGVFSIRQSESSRAQTAYPDGYDPSDHPVRSITWWGAAAYCDWLSMLDGLPRAYDHSTWQCNGHDPYSAEGYRLPTDAEWEFAQQYDDERKYPWGNQYPDCSRANHRSDTEFCVGWSTPVGSYPAAPAALELYDMAGNAFEWTNDWHVCDLGSTPVVDPVGPVSGDRKVARGGAWSNFPYVLGGYRNNNYPDHYIGGWGFRIARTVPSP
jgi:formylglycine-generating enzyme required for sulfatase activity